MVLSEMLSVWRPQDQVERRGEGGEAVSGSMLSPTTNPTIAHMPATAAKSEVRAASATALADGLSVCFIYGIVGRRHRLVDALLGHIEELLVVGEIDENEAHVGITSELVRAKQLTKLLWVKAKLSCGSKESNVAAFDRLLSLLSLHKSSTKNIQRNNDRDGTRNFENKSGQSGGVDSSTSRHMSTKALLRLYISALWSGTVMGLITAKHTPLITKVVDSYVTSRQPAMDPGGVWVSDAQDNMVQTIVNEMRLQEREKQRARGADATWTTTMRVVALPWELHDLDNTLPSTGEMGPHVGGEGKNMWDGDEDLGDLIPSSLGHLHSHLQRRVKPEPSFVFSDMSSSALHRDVSSTLAGMGIHHHNEVALEGGFNVDVLIPKFSGLDMDVILEIDGPSHFDSLDRRPLGPTLLKVPHPNPHSHAHPHLHPNLKSTLKFNTLLPPSQVATVTRDAWR